MNNERTFKLQGAVAIIFSQGISDISAVTGLNYNTVTSYKYRWKRRKLSYEKQEDLVLRFGFKKVDEFRYVFPKPTLKDHLAESNKNS